MIRTEAWGSAASGELDEFRLIRALGHGGMGSVFLGHDTVLDRLVAIKLIRTRAADEASRLRFLTEARAVARLSHPNVVTIFRTATTGEGQPYIAQEWISGARLDRLPLPIEPRRAAEIGLGIARGLAAAHRRGILHRDVKPANVMIDEAGTPKLLDFGLAKLSGIDNAAATGGEDRQALRASLATPGAAPMTPSSETESARGHSGLASTLDVPAATRAAAPERSGVEPIERDEPIERTESGQVLGTPRYLAPEVWAGGPATARSDIYSFGALFYEILAGAPPYPQADRAELEAAVLGGGSPAPLAEAAPGVEPDVAELVAHCLARDPARRPESADEIAHRLERILTGAPAVPDGNPYPGLAAFDAGHRAVFYGRGADVSAVIDRLRGEAVVVVAGDSGIGKSSLCRAGLLPAIEAGALGDGRSWRARAGVLGRDPRGALRDLLGLDELPADPSAVELRRALRLDQYHGLLLFLDQFEEIVTLHDGAGAADVANLLASLAEGVPGLKLLIAVRGDFLTRVASLPALGPLLTRSLHLLRALGAADARQAVVGPARAKGTRFESEAMVDQLTAAVDDDPGALPLLQFALAELWQRRDVDRGIIPESALHQIGGVAGGLARHADGVVTGLGPGERAAARRILLGLVTAEGTRASRERLELVARDDRVGAAALEALVRGRLVVGRDAAEGEPIYTLAHESLLDAWVTLRGWLDDAAGQRRLRTRLGAAADEWRRLGRPADLLWTRIQVAEAAELDELTERDRDFLAASRRSLFLRRAVRVAIVAAIPAAVLATWIGYRLHDERRRDQIAVRRLAAAAEQIDVAEQARASSRTRRQEAFQLFDRNETDRAESGWLEVLSDLMRARGAFRRAAEELEVALLAEARRDDVRPRMARVLYQQALVTEEQGDRAATDDLIRRLQTYDDGTLLAEWRRPAVLEVDAPGAVRIDVRPYIDDRGRLELGESVAAGAGHVLRAALPAGSYMVHLHGADRLVVPSPVMLARGERLALAVPLPRAAEIPDGFVYVPAGRFLSGSGGDDRHRRQFLYAAPLHHAMTGAYLIARHEVTFADWMAYLRALSPAERERRRPRAEAGRTLALRLEGDGPFSLTLWRDDRPYRVAEGEPVVFPGRRVRREVRWERMPVAAVTLEDAIAYASWRATAGGLPGARLCTDLEWERAARGADGRSYPHGETLEPDDANIDITYDRAALGIGPDEVGSHPGSNSPFGAADMTGNVWEMVIGPARELRIRGGSWYQGIRSAHAANREFGEPTSRSPRTGVRLCADPPAVQ